MVYNDTVYVYTGRDKDNSDFYHMPDWHCYSTTDMQNWTDLGTILSWDDFSWGKEDSAWASQCIERNGKFYLYVTLENKSGGGRAIGVAVADSPSGPFKDALNRPLCGPNWEYIDPTVFIDDDGQAWLMFGNPTCYYVKLNEDMISLDGEVKSFDMNTSAFGSTTRENAKTSYGEGPWFYRRNNLYYLVYAAFGPGNGSEDIRYSTAPSPTGPWTYRGVVMPTQGNSFTNHSGIIDYKGKSYFFYHNGALKGGGSFDRSVCVEEFKYNPDGSIPEINMSDNGPAQIESLNPFRKTEAETMCWSEGIKTENCSEGGINIANIENGDYIKVKGVDFGEGADKFTASIASATNGGKIELRIDGADGKLIGTCDVPATSGWQNWKEVSCSVDISGEHDLYMKFTGNNGYLFNVDWWKFDGAGSTYNQESDGYIFNNSFENGTESWTGRGSAKVSINSDVNYSGKSSLYVNGREASWNGAVKKLDSRFKAGSTYSFSVNAMYSKGSDTDLFHFTLQYDGTDGETHYQKIASKTAVKGEWVQLANTQFTLPEGAENMYIYVETDKSTNDFFIDDAVSAEAGTVIEGAKSREVILGDVNFDGVINCYDMSLARKTVLNGTDDRITFKVTDVDQNGKLDTDDLSLIQDFILGKTGEFPKVQAESSKWDEYTETATAEQIKFYKDSICNMGNTYRLAEKLKKAENGESLTVAYLGGSITEGKNYSSPFSDYVKSTFANGSFREINAGMSGTSSVVGLVRSEKDVASQNPDIIFLEFSVNDHEDIMYKKCYESLVKKFLSLPDEPAVIVLINRSKGGYSSQAQMEAIGKNFDVPVISMANALTKAFDSGFLKPDDYFTDEYHPHAKGGQLISDCLAYYFRQAMRSENSSASYTIPNKSVYGSEYSTCVNASKSDLKNFSSGSFAEEKGYGSLPYGYTFQKYGANSPMTFTADGKGLIIVFKANSSGMGNLLVTVNGKTTKISGNKLYTWGGPDAELGYWQDTSGKLDVSVKMEDNSSDFTIWGIGVIK